MMLEQTNQVKINLCFQEVDQEIRGIILSNLEYLLGSTKSIGMNELGSDSDLHDMFKGQQDEHSNSLNILVVWGENFELLKTSIEKITDSRSQTILLSLFLSEESSKQRHYGLRSAKIIALSKEVLLKETTVELLKTAQGKEDLVSTISNYMFYIRNGGHLRANPDLREVWSRYIHANSEINTYHRLFTKAGAFFMKTDTSSLKTGIEARVVPVSLFDFNLPKKFDEQMRSATVNQSILWSRISADFSWQLKSLER